MGPLVPLDDEEVEGGAQSGDIHEVRGPESLAAEDAEPLLDGIHPGTVNGGQVGHEAGMVRQPALPVRSPLRPGWAAQRLKDAEEPKQEKNENNDDNEADDAIGSAHGPPPVLIQGRLQGWGRRWLVSRPKPPPGSPRRTLRLDAELAAGDGSAGCARRAQRLPGKP